MSSELVRAFSLSALLVACAHGSGARDDPNAEARDEQATRHAAAEPDDRPDPKTTGRDVDRAERGEQARADVDLPARSEQDRARTASAGAELPRSEGTELNALDQGSSERDIDLTQRIRKLVMDDDALSFKAKNAKIITRDGHVTLRGSVKTPEEKAAIGKAAIAAAGAAHVTNQLEVSE